MYWQTHMRSLDYATTEDGTSLTLGSGESHRVDFDRDMAWRVELGHMTKAGWGVGVSYTDFDSDGVASVTRPGGTGQLFASLSHPGGPEEADVATATTNFDYQTIDLLATSRFVDRRFKSLDLFGGVRWAQIEHELNATYNGRDFVNGTVSDSVDINAFGFLLGGNAHWKMARGWAVFGRSSFGLMYGSFETSRVETNLDGFEQLVDLRDSYNETMFNFEARLGIEKSLRCLNVSAGYDFNLWTGIGDRVQFVDDIEEAASTVDSGDVLLEGFFVQLSADW